MDVRLESIVICVMVGKNKNIILLIIKLSSVRFKDAKKGHVLIITHKRKGGSSRLKLSIMHSSMYPRTELLRECSKVQSAKEVSNRKLRLRRRLLCNLNFWLLNKMTSNQGR